MSWIVKWDGEEFSSDDLIMDELEAVEKISGEPWSLLNPVRNVASAKALLTVVMMRQGKTDEEIAERMAAVTVKELKTAFDYRKDDEPGPLELVEKATSTGSSTGARSSSTGRRKKSAASASKT